MLEITPHKISKILIYIFLLYMFWFKYAYGVKNIILYSSAILAAACMLYDLLISHKDMRDIVPTGVFINIIMCIYSLVFGFFVARNQESLVEAVKTYSSFSVVCLVICYISKEEKNLDWLLNAIIAIDILCAIYALTRGYYWKRYGYVLGPEHNPNSFGRDMALGLFCLMYRTQKKKKNMILPAGLAILFLYVIIGCGSRKALVVAIILCLLWIFQESRKIWHNGRWIKRVALLIFIALLAVTVIYFYGHVYITTDSAQRMETLGDKSEESSRNRMLYYRFAIDYFLEKPLFGIGLQQFTTWNPLEQYSHSTYAEAIADWGLVGCLIYFIPVIWAAVKLIRMLLLEDNKDITRSFIALWIMEIFLGVGQIWFFSVSHLICWTLVFLYIQMNEATRPAMEKTNKYIKS